MKWCFLEDIDYVAWRNYLSKSHIWIKMGKSWIKFGFDHIFWDDPLAENNIWAINLRSKEDLIDVKST